jgi:hypothetical protein
MREPRRPTKPIEPATPYLLIAVIAVAAHIAVTLWRLRTSYFSLDDFRIIGLAHRSPLNPAYLTADVSGHVEPLSLLVDWLFIHLVGWNYAAVEGILVSMSAATVAMMAAISRRTQATLTVTCIATFSAALSWVAIEPVGMWNNGVQVITSTLLILVGVFICAKPSRSLNLSERALLAVVTVGACAFYNKVCFSIVLFGAIRMFVASCSHSDGARPTLWECVRSTLADILPAIVAVGAFWALIFAENLRSPADHTALVMAKSLNGLAAGVQFGWLQGVVGLRPSGFYFNHAYIGYAIFADFILLALFAASLMYNMRSLWVWVGLTFAVMPALYIIASLRVAYFGVGVMLIGRYHTDEVLMTIASSAVAFGRAFASESVILGSRARLSNKILLIGLIIPVLQFIGGVHYPPVWDTEGNRRFVNKLERSASALSINQSVGDRPLPERIIYRWLRPWNFLSNLGSMLPQPVRTSSWDKATHYMDDDANLRAFADLPRQRFEAIDGTELSLSMVPPFEDVGVFDKEPSDRAAGWFNPTLAPREKVRIAIVAHGRVIAWADRADRPDVGAFFFDGEMMRSGFTAALPSGVPHDELSAVAVIDNRIGIALPQR